MCKGNFCSLFAVLRPKNWNSQKMFSLLRWFWNDLYFNNDITWKPYPVYFQLREKYISALWSNTTPWKSWGASLQAGLISLFIPFFFDFVVNNPSSLSKKVIPIEFQTIYTYIFALILFSYRCVLGF